MERGEERSRTPGGAAGAGVEPWTNVQVGVGARTVAYIWEWVGDRPRRLRVLRSRGGFAAHADEAWQGVGGQLAVYEGEGTSLRDAGLAPLTEYFYTFFARDGAGEWRALLRERIATLAEDAAPCGRPVLGDGPTGDDVALGVLALIDAALDLHSLLRP